MLIPILTGLLVLAFLGAFCLCFSACTRYDAALLPLPALDGGRIFFVVVNGLAALLFKRRIAPKYEGYVHFAGFVCLLGLMVLVAFNDVLKLFGR